MIFKEGIAVKGEINKVAIRLKQKCLIKSGLIRINITQYSTMRHNAVRYDTQF